MKNNNVVEKKLKELKFDPNTIRDIMIDYKNNNKKLSDLTRSKIEFYHKNMIPMAEAINTSLQTSASLNGIEIYHKEYKTLADNLSYSLFLLRQQETYDNVFQIAKFIRQQFDKLNGYNRTFQQQMFPRYADIFNQLVKIERLPYHQKMVLIYALRKLNENQYVNAMSAIQFFLLDEDDDFNFSRFIDDNGCLVTSNVDWYIELYNRYSFQATDTLNTLNELMCSDQYKEYEYLFNHYNKVLKQPINDLSILANKNTKTYLSMHGSKFVYSLISKNKDIRLNMRTVSILPIL